MIPGYTAEYISPEQKSGGELTAVTDLYSWVLTVLEMFCGECGWDDGAQAGKYLYDILDDLRIPIPEDIVNVIKGCLVSDPTERASSIPMIYLLMVSIYNAEFPESRYAGQLSKKRLADTAGTLNNKALSLVDLNEPWQAVKCWQEALKTDCLHPESLYNYGICQWQHGEISDTELLQMFHPDRPDLRKYTEKIQQVTCCEYIRSFEGFDLAVTEVDPENDLRGFSNNVNELAFSGDGSKLLALNETDGKFIIWETDTGKKLAEYPADRRCDIPDENWYCSDIDPAYNELMLEETGFWAVKLKKRTSGQVIKTFDDMEVMPPFTFRACTEINNYKMFTKRNGSGIIRVWKIKR